MKRAINNEAIYSSHGGRVYEAARLAGISPEEVIDFSANINPLGPPAQVLAALERSLSPASLGAYPDEHDFVSAAAEKHSVSPLEVVFGNGSAALMFAVFRAIRPKRVLLLEPAFSEYSRACVAVKAEVTRWLLKEENDFAPDFPSLIGSIDKRQFDLIVLNSPHNPTGALYAREDLLALIDRAEANEVAVVLDEAFIDYAPHASLLHLAAQKSRFVVMRSLTKFYAMPGLRVGYAVCATALASALREQTEAWAVSTVALVAARAALTQEEYESEVRKINAEAREEFAGALRAIGLRVFPSAANFLLARLPLGSGKELGPWLESQRILVRRCNSFRGLGDDYVRLAIRSREDNLRLVTLLEAWLTLNKRPQTMRNER